MNFKNKIGGLSSLAIGVLLGCSAFVFAQTQNGVPTIEELEQQLEAKKAEAANPHPAKKTTVVPPITAPRTIESHTPVDVAIAPKKSPEEVARLIGSIGAHMIEIPGGSFLMGSEAGAPEEKPVHAVTVPAFRLSAYDVTFEQYDAYAEETRRRLPDDEGRGRGNRPVISVSWDDAQGFIIWLNQKTGKRFRLPSEAEWEYAARAATKTRYYWGEQYDVSRANNNHQWTTDVGSFPPNPWGLYDMSGNVWQWTQDCWHENYAEAPTDGSAWTAGDCTRRVVRGGSWHDILPSMLRVSLHNWYNGNAANVIYGFRLAQDR
jgi:formylglycine-generating enzyme required for sulfatase activity